MKWHHPAAKLDPSDLECGSHSTTTLSTDVMQHISVVFIIWYTFYMTLCR